MDYKKNIIDALNILRENSRNEGQVFQLRAYEKVIRNINNIKEKITKYEQVENIDGVGKKIKIKLKEIFETGKLKESEELRPPEDNLLQKLLMIYGVGNVKAKNLINNYKIKSIEDLREKSSKDDKILTKAQKIGLLCYEDLLERIPRKEMLKHQKMLNLEDNKGEIVGSFRRKAETSGDIDVMLNMDKKEFNEFIKELIDKKYLKFILARGDTKLLGICSLKNGKYRRIDLIRNSEEEYPFMKLYFTGSGEFNVAFRTHCLNLGLSLNEHGFTPKIDGLRTEKDIFKYVGIKYVKPENRIDEKSIIIIK
jgi:DNA polymerase/3'-5' exonuclease PolX